jgi:AcrR family transcriptional regulator
MVLKQVRTPVSRERVLRSAVALADEHGIEAVTMRRLAEELGIEAMSLYHHTPNKEAILDGIVDLVFEEMIAAQPTDADAGPWKQRLRSRILRSRLVLLRHPWAPALIESRTAPGLPMALYLDGSIAIMHEGGLSYDLIHHSMHALASRSFGYTREMSDSGGGDAELEAMAAVVPHIVGMLAEVAHDEPGATLGWCDDQTEFEFGLDLLLDGIERKA